MSTLTLQSPCKVNLLLNILGRRDDGFHELESLILPVPLFDEIKLGRTGCEINLICNDSRLPVDGSNLVHRAANAFLREIEFTEGVEIHLQKNLPLAAGIGAGSANAAFTLRGLNELFGNPLKSKALNHLAAKLGSDVPFFLKDGPAMAIGRGEDVETLQPFKALNGAGLLLINPGFGVSTPWAYRELAEYPDVLNGKPGGAQALADALASGSLADAAGLFFNSLEEPVFAKYTVLPVIRDFLREQGALVSLMSGSGATVFALTEGRAEAESLRAIYHDQFGQTGWSRTVLL